MAYISNELVTEIQNRCDIVDVISKYVTLTKRGKNYFGLLQANTILDPSNCVENNGHLQADILGHRYWFHSPDLYNSYDTLFKIEKAKRKEIKKYGRISG